MREPRPMTFQLLDGHGNPVSERIATNVVIRQGGPDLILVDATERVKFKATTPCDDLYLGGDIFDPGGEIVPLFKISAFGLVGGESVVLSPTP